VAPVFGADHAAARAGVPLRDAMTDGDRLAGVLLAAHEDYGGDLLVVFSDVTVEAEAMGATVRFSPDLPPHVAEPAGEIRKLDPERDGRLPVILRAAALARAALPPDLPVLVSLKGPFSLAVLALGMDRLLALAIEDPPKARDAVLAAAESQEAYVAAIVRRGGIPLIGDPFASGSVLGPGHFEALALPGLAGLVFAAHRTGSPAAIHICGDLRPVQRLVHRAGADLLHLEQADFAAATAAGSVVLGGVPTDVFLRDEAAVRAAVRAAANTAPPGHRFILGTACDLPTRADPELARAMVDEARRLPWSP
jgi:uroporphyrinogen decarboxylase